MTQNLLVSSQSVCAFFGITRTTLFKWKKQSTWPVKAQEGTLYDLKAVFDWYVGWKFGNSSMAARKALADTREKEEKARIKKLQREVMESSVIPRDEVLQAFLDRIQVVKAGLMHFNRTLPSQLAGKDPREMGDIIKKNVFQLLERYSRGGGVLRKDGKNS